MTYLLFRRAFHSHSLSTWLLPEQTKPLLSFPSLTHTHTHTHTHPHTQQVKTETNRAEQWRSFHLHGEKTKERVHLLFYHLRQDHSGTAERGGDHQRERKKQNKTKKLCFCSTEVKVDLRFSFCRFWNDVAVISPVDEPDVHEDIRGFLHSWLHFSHPTQLMHSEQSTVSCSNFLRFTTNQTCFCFKITLFLVCACLHCWS